MKNAYLLLVLSLLLSACGFSISYDHESSSKEDPSSVAKFDKEVEIRKIAAKKITNQDDLAYIINFDKNAEVRKIAASKLGEE